jgi:hypothetical protein
MAKRHIGPVQRNGSSYRDFVFWREFQGSSGACEESVKPQFDFMSSAYGKGPYDAVTCEVLRLGAGYNASSPCHSAIQPTSHQLHGRVAFIWRFWLPARLHPAVVLIAPKERKRASDDNGSGFVPVTSYTFQSAPFFRFLAPSQAARKAGIRVIRRGQDAAEGPRGALCGGLIGTRNSVSRLSVLQIFGAACSSRTILSLN